MSDGRYGPNTAAVQRMLARLRSATGEELAALADARSATDVAWLAAWFAAGRAAYLIPWDTSWTDARIDAWDNDREAARLVAWGAIQAVFVAGVISPEQFSTLTASWREVFGPTWEDSWT